MIITGEAKCNEKNIGRYCRWLGIYFLILISGALNIGAFGSLLKAIACIPVLIWLIEKHRIKIDALIFGTILYVFIILISCGWSVAPSLSLVRSITQMLFLILLISANAYSFSIYEIAFLKKCLVWSSRITVILTLVSADYLDGRLYLNGFVKEDPNYLCAYLLFGIISSVITLLSFQKKLKEKALSTIELLIYLYVAIGTGSRGGLLSIICAAIVCFIFYKEDRYSVSHKRIVSRIILLILPLVAYYVLIPIVSADVLGRFSSQAISESQGTGRYELWESAINLFKSSNLLRQLFGYGTATARELSYMYSFSIQNVFHNMFIENLLEIGLVGFICYSTHIFLFVRKSISLKDYFSVAIIVGMIVLSLSTSIYTFKPYWNIMLFIIVLQNMQAKERKRCVNGERENTFGV